MATDEFDAKQHSSDMYKDYLRQNSDKITARQTGTIPLADDINYSNDVSRAIDLKESELKFLTECLEPVEKRYRANARNCMNGYGSCKSEEKANQWKYKADEILRIISKIGEEFI